MIINDDGTFICTMAEWLERGPEMCKQYNVCWVTVTDKGPLVMPCDGDFEYLWMRQFAATQDCVLPTSILPETVITRNGKRFPTESEATEWLSSRCIAWAKGQAS